MEKKRIMLSDYIDHCTHTMGGLTLRTFHFNPIMVNTMVLHDHASGEAIIVDPGNCQERENESLQQYVEQHHLTVKAIVNTHPHIDHIAGNPWCVKQFNAPLYAHAAGMTVYEKAHAYAVAFGLSIAEMPQPDQFLQEGDAITFGAQQLRVLYTPGHCDGSICLYHPEKQFVICGDLLFEGSVGRSDLPTGNGVLLIEMIQQKILPLGDEVVIYPGHGGTTTVGNERKHNPFLV